MAITLDGTNGGTASAGWYAKAPFTGSYTDGIVVDYTTGMGRISVGSADGVTIYNGGVAGTTISSWDASGNLTNAGNVTLGSYSATSVITVKGSSGLTESVGITFGFQSSPSYGGIYVDAPTDTMRFKVLTSEKMRITSAGDLLVATTSTTPAQSNVQGFSLRNGAQFECSGINTQAAFFGRSNDGQVVRFFNAGSTAGNISNSGTTTSYNGTSDYRLKENIQPMVGAVSKVALLKPCTFTWKADGREGQGFIAHELQEVIPDAVTGVKDEVDENGDPEYQGIDPRMIVATLTAAIQELSAELNELKQKVLA